eukprot:1687663-Amphidinium_carterae.1
MKSQGVFDIRLDLDGTRHVEIFTTTPGLKPGSRGRTATGEKPIYKEPDQTPLGAELVSELRSLTMRAHLLSEDRHDIQFTVKQLAREMKQPTAAGWAKLKHLGRYFLTRPRALMRYRWQLWVGELFAATDSDWAAPPR